MKPQKSLININKLLSENYEEEIAKLNKTLLKYKIDIDNLKNDHNKALEKNEELIEGLKRNSIEMNEKW